MIKLSAALLKRVMRIIVISICIGTVVGYFSFQMMMPSVTVPQTTNPSFAVAALVIFVIGVLAGTLSDDLESMTIEMLLGIIIGVAFDWLLFISPSTNPDIIILDASGYIYTVLHSALPLIILSIVALFVGGFLGGMVMENLQGKVGTSIFEKVEQHK
jgi:hypothetical protein